MVAVASLHAQAIYPSCVANQPCELNSNQTNAVVIAPASSFSVTNSGSITLSNSNGLALYNTGNIDSLTSQGSIASNGSGSTYGIRNAMGAAIGTLTNSGTITSSNVAISNNGTITTLINTGSLTGQEKGIGNTSGTLSSISNSGTIVSTVGSAIYIQTGSGTASVGTITNTGTLQGAFASIYNVNASLGTLNNLQGAGNVNGALVYKGILPANYNIIINDQANYGQLSAASTSGSTAFGIHPGSTVTKGRYAQVLSGVAPSSLSTSSGDYNGLQWSLRNASDTVWDLIVTANTADTQQSLENTAAMLKKTFSLQRSVLANSLRHDCPDFDANGLCMSVGGGVTANASDTSLHNVSGFIVGAYRLGPNHRLGAYADQSTSASLSHQVVNLTPKSPLVGFFGAWNERTDGTGFEVKLSLAYGQKHVTVTRPTVGNSDPGSGSSPLTQQGIQLIVKHGFLVAPNMVITPYAGIRQDRHSMDGYSEASSNTVTTPLSYSAIKTQATTALVGAEGFYRYSESLSAFVSAGLETHFKTSNSSYSATGISGLSPIDLNAPAQKYRPAATLGGIYRISHRERITVQGLYRKELQHASSNAAAWVSYTRAL